MGLVEWRVGMKLFVQQQQNNDSWNNLHYHTKWDKMCILTIMKFVYYDIMIYVCKLSTSLPISKW